MVALGGGLRPGHLSLLSAVSSGKSALWGGEFSHAALMQASVNTKPNQLLIDKEIAFRGWNARQSGKTITSVLYRNYLHALEMKAQLENDEGIQSLRRIQLFNRKIWAVIGWHNGVLQPPPDYFDTGKGLYIPDY